MQGRRLLCATALERRGRSAPVILGTGPASCHDGECSRQPGKPNGCARYDTPRPAGPTAASQNLTRFTAAPGRKDKPSRAGRAVHEGCRGVKTPLRCSAQLAAANTVISSTSIVSWPQASVAAGSPERLAAPLRAEDLVEPLKDPAPRKTQNPQTPPSARYRSDLGYHPLWAGGAVKVIDCRNFVKNKIETIA